MFNVRSAVRRMKASPTLLNHIDNFKKYEKDYKRFKNEKNSQEMKKCVEELKKLAKMIRESKYFDRSAAITVDYNGFVRQTQAPQRTVITATVTTRTRTTSLSPRTLTRFNNLKATTQPTNKTKTTHAVQTPLSPETLARFARLKTTKGGEKPKKIKLSKV